jgi:hypothetical protein
VVVERVGLFPRAASLSMRGVGYSGIESFTDPGRGGLRERHLPGAQRHRAEPDRGRGFRSKCCAGRKARCTAETPTPAPSRCRPTVRTWTSSAARRSPPSGNKGLRGLRPDRERADLQGHPGRAHRDALAPSGRLCWTNNGLVRGWSIRPSPASAWAREDSFVIRPTLRFTPNSKLDIQLIGEFLREKDEAAPIASLPITPNASSPTGFNNSAIVGFGGFQHNPFGDKRVGIPSDGTDPFVTGFGLGDRPMKFDQDSYTLDAGYDLGFGKLKLLANHQRTHSIVYVDTDGSVANIFSSGRWEHHKADSAELQFVSSWDGRST